VFLAVACEIISALGFYAILTTNAPAQTTPVKPTPAPIRWKPPK
jgi:hypothetical protein